MKLRRRISEADPIISMAQRGFDWGVKLWPPLFAFFAAGGSVGALGYVTDWAKNLGPLGLALIALSSALSTTMVVSATQLWRTKRGLIKAQTADVIRWRDGIASINPLDHEFHNKRILLENLAHPIDNTVRNKRLIGCDIIGPRNIAFLGGTISNTMFNGCDFIIVRSDCVTYNVTHLVDCTIFNCNIWRCTVFVAQQNIDNLGFRLNPITLTGLDDYDGKPFQKLE